MKHTTLISLGAAVSLAACHDTTAPESRPEPRPMSADAALAAPVDSTGVWASLALDDAATRLLSAVADGEARSDLKRALHALSAHLVRRDNDAAARAYHELATRALTQLRDVSDPASVPDLDAIAFALDGASSLLNAHANKDQR